VSEHDDAADLSDSEQCVLEALSHHVADGRQAEPALLGSVVKQARVPAAVVFEGIQQLRHRGWVVCTGSIHLSHDDRCLLLGEGLARAAVMAAKRELALFEVFVGSQHYLVAYEHRANAKRSESEWSARAFAAERAGAPPLMEAEGVTREDARDALVDRLSAADSGHRFPSARH